MVDRHDLCVVGAGIAGTALANACAKQGLRVALLERVHPHKPCLKAEQASAECVELLERMGFRDLHRVTTEVTWAASWLGELSLGPTRLVRPDITFEYHQLVNQLRTGLDPAVDFYTGEPVVAVERSGDSTIVRSRNGRETRARAVVVATGDSRQLMTPFAGDAAQERTHGTTLVGAWDIDGELPEVWGRRVDRCTFHRPTGNGVGYVTIFRRAGTLRANVFVPGRGGDALETGLRSDPLRVCGADSPAWRRATRGWRVSSPIARRPTHLGAYTCDGAPFVAIGDAAHVVDPSGGEGTRLALEEAWLLASTYLPRWLEDGGLPERASGDFRGDPERSARESRLFKMGEDIHALYTARGVRGQLLRTGFAVTYGALAVRQLAADLVSPFRARPSVDG